MEIDLISVSSRFNRLLRYRYTIRKPKDSTSLSVFFMANIYRIPSKLYYELFLKGGDRLIAVYAILKKSKKEDVKYYSFTSKNGKKVSHYNLIRNYTGLTLHSIKKYTDVLIDLGLCSFDKDGNFVLVGNQKLKRIYNNKLVPIIIGKNIVETSYNSYAVRLHSNSKQQKASISKKTHQRVLLSKDEKDLTWTDLKEKKSLLKKNIQPKGFFIDKSVLSVRKFANLKDGSKSNKCKGQYWKRKAIGIGIIQPTRRFVLQEKMTKAYFRKNSISFPKEFKHFKGNLVREIVSEIHVKTITKNRVNKSYLL